MARIRWWVGLAAVVAVGPIRAQERVDLPMIAKIREEGFQRSQVMDLAWYLTEVLGPRLTGAPATHRAERWAKTKLEELGLVNVAIEPFGEHGVGWANQYTSLHLLEPTYQPLIGYPQAFTPGTAGKLVGAAQIVSIHSEADLAKYRGKLKGAIVLATPPMPVGPRFTADAHRFDAETLDRMARATIGSRFEYEGRPNEWNDDIRTFLPVGNGGPGSGVSAVDILKFLKAEGVGVVLEAAPGGDGTVFVDGRAGSRQDRSFAGVQASPPVVSVAAEHYNRVYRLASHGIPTKLEIEVRNGLDNSDTKGYNVLGEIRGSDLADELVMTGGHFDSWHAATGATDDAAGVAVAIEALRILQTVGAKPRRTIRIGLWSYEEGGVNGSRGYVKAHFGDRAHPTPQYDKLAGYFNVDNGGGRIRGVYLQGNEGVRPIFEAWIKPFADLEMTTLTIANEFGVDAVAFDMAGLPGFQFIQDPMDYDTRTHHSNMDVYDKLVPDDLRRNAVILASFLYQAAMRDQPLPREAH